MNKKSSFFTEKSQLSAQSPSNQPSPVAGHKRTRTFDLRTLAPSRDAYQLEPKFSTLALLQRKDSGPPKPDPLRELLRSSEFPSRPKPPRALHVPSSSSTQGQQPPANSKAPSQQLSLGFLKDLTRIYDSGARTSRTVQEYERFFQTQYGALDRNLQSVNSAERRDLALPRETYLAEEHRLLLARVRNRDRHPAETLSSSFRGFRR